MEPLVWVHFTLNLVILLMLILNLWKVVKVREKQKAIHATLIALLNSVGSFQSRFRTMKRSDATPRRERAKQDPVVHRDAPTRATARMSDVKRRGYSKPSGVNGSGRLQAYPGHRPDVDGSIPRQGDSAADAGSVSLEQRADPQAYEEGPRIVHPKDNPLEF